jgi:hypothetical protein
VLRQYSGPVEAGKHPSGQPLRRSASNVKLCSDNEPAIIKVAKSVSKMLSFALKVPGGHRHVMRVLKEDLLYHFFEK